MQQHLLCVYITCPLQMIQRDEWHVLRVGYAGKGAFYFHDAESGAGAQFGVDEADPEVTYEEGDYEERHLKQAARQAREAFEAKAAAMKIERDRRATELAEKQ